jgi:peptidoglycan-N-acetylglucosamine deacetylase
MKIMRKQDMTVGKIQYRLVSRAGRWFGAAGITALALGIVGPPNTASTVRAAIAVPKPPQSVPLPPKIDRTWLDAKHEVDRNVADLLDQHQTELWRGVKYAKLMRGDINKKQIALTFDDGPHPAFTPQLLAILRQYNVKATFFIVGEMAEKYPWLVRREVAAGMAIGNHTYHHVNLTKIPQDDVATEIKACGLVLKNITKHNVNIFRPPGGDYDKQVAEASAVLGYKMILWTDDPGDYAKPGKRTIETRLLDRVSNGGIILIHDGIQQTIDILPQVIEKLRSRGFEFVTIPEMVASKQAAGRGQGLVSRGSTEQVKRRSFAPKVIGKR